MNHQIVHRWMMKMVHYGKIQATITENHVGGGDDGDDFCSSCVRKSSCDSAM